MTEMRSPVDTRKSLRMRPNNPRPQIRQQTHTHTHTHTHKSEHQLDTYKHILGNAAVVFVFQVILCTRESHLGLSLSLSLSLSILIVSTNSLIYHTTTQPHCSVTF